ncbi:MAG: hypothetical protein ACRDY7_05190 [Acidimicrobiia bacterium]
MVGAIVLIVVMLVVAPALLFAAGAAWSAFLGRALEADRRPAEPAEPADG